MDFNLVAILFCIAGTMYALPVQDENEALKRSGGAIGRVNIKIDFHVTKSTDERSSAHTFFPRYESSEHFDTTENQTTDENIGTKRSADITEEKSDPPSDLTYLKKLWDFVVMQAKECKFREDEDVKEPINIPDICEDASLDTITKASDGGTYAFKGDFCWKIYSDAIVDGYPKRIADDWDGLEGKLDASFTAPDGKTYFFKGSHYWSFTNKKMDSGYPKLISEGFKGIPDNLDAAFTFGGNGKPYFFKGGQYWRYDAGKDPPVKDEYPMPITDWKGLPIDGIDAAFMWENKASYFFNKRNYYRFDAASFEVSKHFNYPAPTASGWFSCADLS